ncbi:MAG TPA: hypothetical protein VMR25_00970 [Planctomycetaceae bacterium]|jgi:hypothetical protein|nr:hypothetical protein [Planctomycetaceae bacterium]
MMWFTLSPILAAPQMEIYRLVILALLMLGGTIIKKISDAREQAERAKAARTAKPPAGRPSSAPPQRDNEFRGSDTARPAEPATSARRDNPFRNEIEAFLEEVGRRRTPSDARQQRGEAERGAISTAPTLARPVVRQQTPQQIPPPMQRTASSAVRPKSEVSKAVPQAAPQTAAPRPGAEIASRKAPVSDDLGAQIRSHLSHYLDSSQLSQRAKADLGNAVDRAVREHLGNTTTGGPQGQDSLNVAAQSGAPIAALLRDPAGVRTAILVNEILQRPKCLRRES